MQTEDGISHREWSVDFIMLRGTTLDAALDKVMSLPPEEQDALVDIVRQRRLETRREEWHRAAEEALAAYKRGEIPALTAEEAILELRRESTVS